MAFSRAWNLSWGFHVYYDDIDHSADVPVFFFFFFGIWCGTPAFQAGVNHSSRQSCVSTLQLFFLTGLMLNHAWVILILSENCSLVEETLFYTFLLCCKCVKMVFRCSLGTSVSVGKFPQQVWVWVCGAAQWPQAEDAGRKRWIKTEVIKGFWKENVQYVDWM